MSNVDTKHLLARFYNHEVIDFERSTPGHKVMRRVPYIELRVKGDKNSSYSRPVQDDDKHNFPDAWARFEREGDSGQIAGVALTVLPGVTTAVADELYEVGVRTIEDLAELADGLAVKIRGGMTIKHRAIAYLKKLEELSDPENLDTTTELVSENESLKARIAELEAAAKPQPKRRVNG